MLNVDIISLSVPFRSRSLTNANDALFAVSRTNECVSNFFLNEQDIILAMQNAEERTSLLSMSLILHKALCILKYGFSCRFRNIVSFSLSSPLFANGFAVAFCCLLE